MLATAATVPASVPAPLTDRTTALTPRGHAALAIVRLDDQMRELEPNDRAYILDMLREILDGAEVAG